MSEEIMQNLEMDEDEQEPVTLQIHKETEKAILVSGDGKEKSGVWLPKSQISFTLVGDCFVDVIAPEWLLIEKGLE